MGQPIIRGIQAVGAVDIYYTYNGDNNKMSIPTSLISNNSDSSTTSITLSSVPVIGFRLDGEFLKATQQIASSVMVPILGGGAIALTNNCRSGTLNIRSTKTTTVANASNTSYGALVGSSGIGILSADGSSYTSTAYDLVTLAQLQQAAYGGDSVGADITVKFQFNGCTTQITFEACTIANVSPLGLAGNDAVDYDVQINYLNWKIVYNVS